MPDARRRVDINIKTTADTSGADEAAASLDKVDKATGNVDASTTKGTKSSKALGSAFGNVGAQVQDMVVQIDGGTSSLQAFTQQAPQLASAFGPGGAAFGAIVALGAVAYKVFTADVQKGLKDSTELAKEMALALQEAAKEAGKEEWEFFERMLDSIATNQENINTAAKNAATASRDQASAVDEIQAAYRNALAAANEFRAATDPNFKQNKTAEDNANRTAKRNSDVRQQTDRQDAAVEAINAINSGYGVLQEQLRAALATQEKNQNEASQINAELQRLLTLDPDRKAFAAKIQSLEADLTTLAEQTGPNSKEIASLEARLAGFAESTLQGVEAQQAIITDAQTEIDKINQIYNAEQAAADSKAATDSVKQTVEQTKQFATDFKAQSAVQAEATAILAESAKDGIITAEEAKKNAAALKLLQGTLHSSQVGMNENINSLIALTNEALTKINQQATAIAGLNRKIEGRSIKD
jgi:hypothetical protein